MKKFLNEPLVHFLLIGLGIFFVYSFIASDEGARDEIIITDSDVSHMIEIWKLTWQREPTEEELAGLVSGAIRQEILYREALKMNLDHDDEVVKRRLAQKMDFLSNDISAIVNPPSDEVLKKYFEKHADKYKLPARYTLQQVVFTSDHYDNPEEEAKKALKNIREGRVNPTQLGKTLSLPARYTGISANRLNTELGGNFADGLRDLPGQQWAGPVESGFGWHLVKIEEFQEPALPAFKQIRGALERDYAYEKEQESQERIYQQLRLGYDIELQAELSPELSKKIKEEIDG